MPISETELALLRRLERRVRLLTVALVVVILVFVVAWAVVGRRITQSFYSDALYAESLALLQPDLRTAMTGGFELQAAGNTARLYLGRLVNAPAIQLVTKANGTATLEFRDARGRLRVVLGLTDQQEPDLVFVDEHGNRTSVSRQSTDKPR